MRVRFSQLSKKMKLFHKILLLICILVPSLAQAQFYVTGDDPGKLKWNYIDTDNFRVIYPEGSDSLARIYAFKLEKYKIPVSRTTGYMAGHGDGRLMPAVLHTYNGANGSVAWAPKRMDLFTLPTPYNPEPMPWSTMLAVHEGRHVTQMQFGMTGNHKPFGYIFGEMWNILVSLVYPRMEGIEGDAVITETALTSSGRGRTADFLNYYRVAFDQGDYREWDRWLYGSQKYFAPDHYAFGYMTYGGLRYIYDYPMFMNDVYGNASKKILNIFPIPTLVKKKTGKKFGEMFKEVTDTMQGIWSRDAQERAPFIPMEKVTEEPRLYTNYSNTISHGNSLYTIKKGYLDSPKLIRIDVYGDEHFMIDTGGGSGVLTNLEKLGISFNKVHHIFLSHCHTDHVMGAVGMLRMIGQSMQKGVYEGNLHLDCHKDIAEGLFISSKSISGAIRKLVTDNYVEKVGENPSVYSITEKGKNIEIK